MRDFSYQKLRRRRAGPLGLYSPGKMFLGGLKIRKFARRNQTILYGINVYEYYSGRFL